MPQLPQSIVNTTKNAYYNTYPYGPQEMGDAYPELADTGKSTTSSNNFFSSGVGFGTIRQIGNNIMGGAVNKQYDYLNSPYSQQVKDLFDATQDPIARAVKNWTGKSRDNILSAIHEDTPNEDLFKFSISGNDNASLLNNFNYRQHSDEELGIRQNIRQKDFWSAFGDFNNQAGVGALYGAEMGGGWGALAGLATGIGMGINNWIYDSKNTKRFNDAINQGNLLKRMREANYQDEYLAQYNNQVENVAMNDYRSNIRNYYGILKNGGFIGNIFRDGGIDDENISPAVARVRRLTKSSNRQPIYGTWNGFYDAIYKDKPLVTPKEEGSFGGGQSSGAGHSGRWGDIDYIENTFVPPISRSFNEAFADARQKGLSVFDFNGKLYSTEVDPNYKGSGKKEREILTPAGNIRKVYTKEGEELPDSTRFEVGVIKPIGWTERETRNGKTSLKYIGANPFKDGGSIHIKPENRGKFTALKERTGHSATWFKENGTPAQKKMAVFELNSKKWKHRNGGYLNALIEGEIYDLTEDSINNLISQGYEIEYI